MNDLTQLIAVEMSGYWATEFWTKVDHGSPDAVSVAWRRWRSYARKERDGG